MARAEYRVRMVFTAAAVAIAAAALCGPEGAAAQRPPDTQAADQVRAARVAQNAALASRALDSAAAFWTADVVVVASRGTVLRGKDAYRQAFAGDERVVYQRLPERIEASSAWPLAWEEGTWTGRSGPDGPAVIGGRYAAQWHRVDGRWLIRAEIFVGLTCAGEPCTWQVQPPP